MPNVLILKMWAHLGIGFTARMLLICFSEIQDRVSEVQYTDIDYRVFTDAARHVLKNESPYERFTYRYTPVIAYLLTPNIIFHPAWGKVLFSLLDIFVAVLIKSIIIRQHGKRHESMAEKCALAWLYNPLSIVISTRGNGDSLAAVLVTLSLLLLMKKEYLLAGVVHGWAIHIRLYPLAFSLAMYASIPVEASPGQQQTLLTKVRNVFTPSFDRFKLILGCLMTLMGLTFVFYKLYGNTFLEESILFHLKRQDIRHNFSVYFYHQYLSMSNTSNVYYRVVTVLPQVILLVVLSIIYGTPRDVMFGILCQAVVLVAYNSVLTCQYFIWFLSLLPISLPALSLTKRQGIVLGLIWLAAQLAWLLPAYWLEFRGRNTFLYIWLQGIAFFCANMAVLARLIRSYQPKMKVQ